MLRCVMKNFISRFITARFDKNLDIQVQVFNLLTMVGMAGGVGVALVAALIKENIAIIGIDLSVALLSYGLLRFAEKKKCHHFCTWLIVVLVFMLMFPVLFFYCGGYKSGAAYAFMTGLVYTALLLDKAERNTALTVEFVLYVACCLVSYFKPEMASHLPSELDYLIVTILNFTITCVFVLSVLLIRNRMLRSRQTQIQELNRELEARNESLAKYDQMKSDFLATVAHDINTPLAVISASSSDTLDLLKEMPLDMEEIIKNQMVIERRVKLIDSIILDLMDTVAIENGRLSLNRQPVNLSELLEIVCSTQFEKLDTNKNSIIYDFEPGLPEVWADPVRIEQVITNLLSNAVHFTKNGVITVKLAQTDKGQAVSVSDNGEGMDEKTAQSALKQYVSTKTDYWRHGIGLHICRRIIMAHGGEIWIDSEKGRGTKISFTLGGQ